MKEKKCIFCDWEDLYLTRRGYDWNYICRICKVKCNLTEDMMGYERSSHKGDEK